MVDRPATAKAAPLWPDWSRGTTEQVHIPPSQPASQVRRDRLARRQQRRRQTALARCDRGAIEEHEDQTVPTLKKWLKGNMTLCNVFLHCTGPSLGRRCLCLRRAATAAQSPPSLSSWNYHSPLCRTEDRFLARNKCLEQCRHSPRKGTLWLPARDCSGCWCTRRRGTWVMQ